jgi:hypothetical protein
VAEDKVRKIRVSFMRLEIKAAGGNNTVSR